MREVLTRTVIVFAVLLCAAVPANAQLRNPGVECFAMFPTLYRASDGLSAPPAPNLVLRQHAEMISAAAYRVLHSARDEIALDKGLAPFTTDPNFQNSQYPLWPWRAALWSACHALENGKRITLREYFEVQMLEKVYERRITNSSLAGSISQNCSFEAWDPANVIQLWPMWMAFNNGLWSQAIAGARTYDPLFVNDAEEGNRKFHEDPDSGTMCQKFKRGLINDVAAERYILAQSLVDKGGASKVDLESAYDSEMCVDKGRVYDWRGAGFWPPSTTVPSGHSCRQ